MPELPDIGLGGLAASYLLLLIPLSIFLHLGVPLLRQMLVSTLRMTLQLLFVGFYLHVVFRINHAGLNLLWLLAMVAVADGSILKGCGLRTRSFALPVGASILLGTAIPVLMFTGGILRLPRLLEAQYLIPIGGMILGNCLRADIVGLTEFTKTLSRESAAHHQRLAQGATLAEALRPPFRNALRAALSPTLATMATIGLVSLPGMMTGVMLAGGNPMTAIRYQIAIMIAIFSGTALTVTLAILFSRPVCLDAYGLPRGDLFSPAPTRPKSRSGGAVRKG